MTFRPPGNVNKRSVSKIRSFDGIGGPQFQILKRTNERGGDISNSVANEVWDLSCGEFGTLRNREGCRKIDDTGKTASLTSIFFFNLGGKRRYGIIYDGALDVIDVPEWLSLPQDPFVLDPEPEGVTLTTIYPGADPAMPL